MLIGTIIAFLLFRSGIKYQRVSNVNVMINIAPAERIDLNCILCTTRNEKVKTIDDVGKIIAFSKKKNKIISVGFADKYIPPTLSYDFDPLWGTFRSSWPILTNSYLI